MSDFKKLKVWQKAHGLSLHAHRVAQRIRGRDYAALRSQLVRAAGSIPANIVEGRAEKGEAQFARFVGHAISSAAEFENHLANARDLGVMTRSDYLALTDRLTEVRMMLYGLLRSLRDDDGKGNRE